MITLKEVRHVAGLARLGMTKSEEEKFRKELSSILGYMEKLKKVNVSQIKLASHLSAIENVERGDEARAGGIAKSRKLLEMAPEVKDAYIKVKSILK